MNPLDRLDQLAAPGAIGARYGHPPKDSGAPAAPVRALRLAKVTSAPLESGWNAEVLANPVTGGVVRTTRVLTLKATCRPNEDLGGDPWSQEQRVGFAHINVGDVVGYIPFAAAERAASGYDGVIVPHAGDLADVDTGAILSSTPVGAEITHFWGTITGGAGPTYAWTGDPGYSGGAAVEVNGVLGIGVGTRVRMFDYEDEGEPKFEYDPLGDADDYTGGPGIAVAGLVISFDYDALKGLGVEGAGDAAIAVVKLTADKGLQFTAVTGGIEVVPNEAAGITVDAGGVAIKLEAAATSSLAFDGATGEVKHALQAAAFGEGMPTGISGENLAYDDVEPYVIFDVTGHFHPLTNVNVVIHTTHGAEVGVTGLDANGHVVAATRVVPAGTNAGDILYWNGSAWTILATPGAGAFVLYCTNNVLHWVS